MDQKLPAFGTTYQGVLGTIINAKRSSAEKPITQAEIANELGINVSTWSRIERGESPLTLEQLVSVAIFLDFPLSELFLQVEKQIDELGKKGVRVAVSKEALEPDGFIKLNADQLAKMSTIIMLGGPIGWVGAGAYFAYKALIKKLK